MNNEIKIRLERVNTMRAVFFYEFSSNPEEKTWEKAKKWAEIKGLLKKNAQTRIFGRNFYPTENPEPHGYSYYITIKPDTKIDSDVLVRMIPGGLYAVARCEGFEQMGLGWPELWKWVEESKYKYIGETKQEFGYELGFEEHLNWYSTLIEKSENTYIFDLMIQLWEE